MALSLVCLCSGRFLKRARFWEVPCMTPWKGKAPPADGGRYTDLAHRYASIAMSGPHCWKDWR